MTDSEEFRRVLNRFNIKYIWDEDFHDKNELDTFYKDGAGSIVLVFDKSGEFVAWQLNTGMRY